MSKLICDLLPVTVIATAFYKNKNIILNLKVDDLLKTIIIYMNWQDIQSTKHKKIDFLIIKYFSFYLLILRQYEINKQILYAA